MTNTELFARMQIIETENNNIFDKYCALKEMEEEYRTTPFSISFPNYSIIEAFDLYIKDSTSVGTLLRDFKNVDLPQLFGIITENLDVTKTLENLDESTADLLKMILERN